MEAVEEPPLQNAQVDGMKISVVFVENDENAAASTDVCHKSNGVAHSVSSDVAPVESYTAPKEDGKCEMETTANVVQNEMAETIEVPAVLAVLNTETKTDLAVGIAEQKTDNPTTDIQETIKEEVNNVEKNGFEETHLDETTVEMDSTVEPPMDRVTFETEILVETNDNEVIEETVTEETAVVDQDSNNLLSELGHSIELSEALRSSDVTDSAENNNCAVRQEVFNKEELLDILEGNDQEPQANTIKVNFKNMNPDKMTETQLALQQLSRLKKQPKKRSFERLSRSRKSDKKGVNQENKQQAKREVPAEDQSETAEVTNENIVNVLVKEWDDEETPEVDKSDTILEESENLLKSTNEVLKIQEAVSKEDEEVSARTSIDSTEGETTVLNKSGDEGQPQRRLGRVVKKKVIFDPGNPDTFTKTKPVPVKSEPNVEKDVTPSKKIKTEPTFQRSKSKSPMSKLQWKKPTPKNCKQNKRLTEIDRLLMDEGAVNMIYQLTPEALKGKKNMKTKAEFIKKIQSSTPDSKEMKFRERKKESKYKDGEPRKILGGKQRSSLSSSVKSPSAVEDFEAHSADDSIIYRRHSSSSYSSSCMSPRRLSDVETSNQSSSRNTSQVAQVDVSLPVETENISNRSISAVFMSDTTAVARPDTTINKDDCMSIKEKLNSKLNLALNKRKRENSKPEKPSKLKKIVKSDEKTPIKIEDFKYLSINFDQRLAEICVQKPGSKCNIEVLKEFKSALQLIESRKDISVTLISSECGSTCSDLDLRPLLDNNVEKSTNFAYEMAESIRSLLHAVEKHSKLLCAGMSGRCSGIGLALIGLSDVTMASTSATFSISPKSNAAVAPIAPGMSVFTTYRLLPQPLLNDFIVFGRRLTASEALQSGVVSRTLCLLPESFNGEVHNIAKDIATQPAQNIWLKKQLLNMKKTGSESTFLSYLEKERDLLVEYWTSVEGQEILRATYNAA